MNEDARFEDGRDKPLNLGAQDVEDLEVLSTLIQDAVFPATEMKWLAAESRLVLLVNRFRWEDLQAAERGRRAVERVQSLLVIDNVIGVASLGIDRTDANIILSILSISFVPGKDGVGFVDLTLAGDGGVRVSVEALELTLKDVTRPYMAPSRQKPNHDV